MSEVDHNEVSGDDELAEALETFLAARDSGSPLSRTTFLNQHPEIKGDLEECLESLDYIEQTTGLVPATGSLEVGDLFGEYEILREIARGGMGVVYEAFHTGLERRVALKVLSARRFNDERYRQMFLVEARTAAGLHHTNIVPVFEVGQMDQVCYYAMQFIEGHNLAALVKFLRRKSEATASTQSDGDEAELVLKGDPSKRWHRLLQGPKHPNYFQDVAQLIADVAASLHHAHKSGIVHRDIKPSNIVMDQSSRPWITDFGLAFRPDEANDGDGEPVGTPLYMSPEQASGGGTPVEFQTDVYSLGATLYELLTLRPIFESKSSFALLENIQHKDPRPLRQIDSRIPKDLEAITTRAISKNPIDRYGSAQELADDLIAFTTHYPVKARHAWPHDRVLRWCRREPSLAAVSILGIFALVAVMIVSHAFILKERDVAIEAGRAASQQGAVARRERDRSLDAERKAKILRGDALYQTARASILSIGSGRRSTALTAIQEALPTRATSDWRDLLRDEAVAALGIFDVTLARSFETSEPVQHVAFCGHDNLLLAIDRNRDASLWMLDTPDEGAQTIQTFRSNGDIRPTTPFAVSACGKYMAISNESDSVDIWDLQSRAIIQAFDSRKIGYVRFIAFAGDHNRLVTVNRDGTCHMWELDQSESPATKLEFGAFRTITQGPNQDEITTLSREGVVTIWSLTTGDTWSFETGQPANSRLRFFDPPLQWDAQGSRLAIGAKPGVIEVWETQTQKSIATLVSKRAFSSVAFDPTGFLIATTEYADPHIRLWDVSSGHLVTEVDPPGSGPASNVTFSANGKYLGASNWGKTISVWEVEQPTYVDQLGGAEDSLRAVTLSPDRRFAAAVQQDDTVQIWRVEMLGSPILTLKPERSSDEDPSNDNIFGQPHVVFSPDSRRIALRATDNSLHVWQAETGRLIGTHKSKTGMGGAGPIFASRHGHLLFYEGLRSRRRGGSRRSQRSQILEWEISETVSDPAVLHTVSGYIRGMVASPDQKLAAMLCLNSWKQRLEIRDLETGEVIGAPIAIASFEVAVAFSADGSKVLWCGGDRIVHVMNTDGSNRQSFEAEGDVTTVAASQSGTIAAGTREGAIEIYQSENGRRLTKLPGHVGGTTALQFMGDSNNLLTCGDDNLVRIWKLDRLHSELTSLELAW